MIRLRKTACLLNCLLMHGVVGFEKSNKMFASSSKVNPQHGRCQLSKDGIAGNTSIYIMKGWPGL